eukprot:13631187-Alexandrium_andersonii.AAC.1
MATTARAATLSSAQKRLSPEPSAKSQRCLAISAKGTPVLAHSSWPPSSAGPPPLLLRRVLNDPDVLAQHVRRVGAVLVLDELGLLAS